ncbi:MAG: IS66-like element accessory protein TnpA [Janthinobacterium lividum]
MFDVNDDAKAGYRRVEVLTGPGRRRHWSDDEKARILAETRIAGASVSAVARRWQVCPQQVFGWRRQACLEDGGSSRARGCARTAFVPIVTGVVPSPTQTAAPASATIEVRMAGAVVRVVAGTDAALLATVLRAVRASASPA